jgi:hypothetical protein
MSSRGAHGNGEPAGVHTHRRPEMNTRTIAIIALVVAVVVLILLLL